MISKENFTFTIGFHGETAIVDGKLKSKFKNDSALELAESGLFKAALANAVYGEENDTLTKVLEIYNRKSSQKIESIASLKRLYGILSVPEGINNTLII